MAPPTIPSASVTDRCRNFTTIARLESILASKKSSEGQEKLLNLLFTDEEGTEMPATIFETEIPSFKKILHEGHEYEITNPTVRVIPEKYRFGNQVYQMTLQAGLRMNDLGPIAVTRTYWVPVNSVEENLGRQGRIDLLGVAILVRSLRTTINKTTGDENEARDIVIVDQQMKPVVVTAWRVLALEPTEKIARAIDFLPVIQITRVRASDYRGGCWGTTRFSSIRLADTDHAAEELRIWATENKESLRRLSNNFQSNVFGESSTSQTDSSEMPISITSLPDQEANKIIHIQGQIKSITNPDNYTYNSCNKCRKTTSTQTGESFRCEAGQTPHNGISKSTCALRIIFSDNTGDTRISLFDSLAETILCRTTAELAALTTEERRSVVDETFARIKDKYYVIQMLSYMKNDPVPQVRFIPQMITESNV